MAIKIQHANQRDYKKTVMLIEISVQTSYIERRTSTEQPDSPAAVFFPDVSLLAYKYTPVPHHFLNLLINLGECLRVKMCAPPLANFSSCNKN